MYGKTNRVCQSKTHMSIGIHPVSLSVNSNIINIIKHFLNSISDITVSLNYPLEQGISEVVFYIGLVCWPSFFFGSNLK